MSSIVWNTRGLGNKRAFRSLQRLVLEHRPILLFISESKISCQLGLCWKSLLGFSGCLGVDSVGRSGGLLLFWNNEINVCLRSYSIGNIDCNGLFL